MKKKIIKIFFLCSLASLFLPIYVEDSKNFLDDNVKEISRDTTWNGNVLLSNSVIVKAGVTLTILPGAKVKFKFYRGYRELEKRLGMLVFGRIIAEGTVSQQIYFTSDAPQPQNGDWRMLRLYSNTAQSRFQFCVFEFAQHGLNIWNSSPIISNCVFRWNNWEGVYFESFCQPVIKYTQIYQNGYNGMAAEQSNNTLMDSCDVWENGTNGIHTDNSVLEIRRSKVHDNFANGLSVDNNGTLRAFGISISGNKNCGISIGEGNNVVQVGNVKFSGNLANNVCGKLDSVATTFLFPNVVNIGFDADQSYALGYTPGDRAKDKYMYVYPDDETRKIINKIGEGLGLTWAVTWDGKYIWTCTVWNHVYKIDPVTKAVVEDFLIKGSQQWGSPSQPWGMTIDDEKYLWIVDFAERKLFKIDPTTRSVIFSFNSPNAQVGGCKGLEWDGKYLNVMGWVKSEIYQMTKGGQLVKTIVLPEGNGGLTFDGKYFWVPLGDSKILKYDTDGKLAGWIYAASEGTWDLTYDGKYLWATQRTNENWQDEKIFQIQILDDHSTPTYVDETKNIPNEFALYQNYPNPFNPSTNIKFALPKSSHIKLTIYDALGKEVVTLVNSELASGTHTISWNASNLASGIYLYKIGTNDFVKVNKMLLLK